MIPYEELVAALASWRQRQGLPAGPADYLGEPPQAGYEYAPAASPAAYNEDVVELSDDMMDSMVEEQSNPYAVEAVETVDYGEQVADSDTQDQDIDAYLDSAIPAEPPKPAPEPEPEKSGGRRKRKK